MRVIDQVIERVEQALPPSTAMASLRPTTFRTEAAIIAEHEADLKAFPEVLAGLWLYVDDLEKAHTVAQGLDTPTGSWWHAIVHRREGDFSNSKYWYRRATGTADIPVGLRAPFDPYAFVDAVEAAGGDPADLVARQREEWQTLFDFCLQQVMP